MILKDWADRLAEAEVGGDEKKAWKRQIIFFLSWCKRERRVASVETCKDYLEDLGRRMPGAAVTARAALRWFVKEARLHGDEPGEFRGGRWAYSPRRGEALGCKGSEKVSTDDGKAGHFPSKSTEETARAGEVARHVGRPAGGEVWRQSGGVPPPAGADDLGGPVWERALIAAMRKKHLLWRSEQTYRMWAKRYVDFIAPKQPHGAGAVEIGAFLEDLAVRQRCSPSTQKQALNALVFFYKEGLRTEPGEIEFERARPQVRVPIILSRPEVRRVFGQLSGTHRTMARLAYGSGLRLLELLRLRIQDLDFERAKLIVRAGKGGKDRVTILPHVLGTELRAHIERLRSLHAEDRAAGLPGVWLPEGLARKYPTAGVKWEWPRIGYATRL